MPPLDVEIENCTFKDGLQHGILFPFTMIYKVKSNLFIFSDQKGFYADCKNSDLYYFGLIVGFFLLFMLPLILSVFNSIFWDIIRSSNKISDK